jgi:flagellar biosynthesis/type III secretory pathway M-ring protein FliF/YscJ
MKRTIRLNESALKHMIAESVKNILKENISVGPEHKIYDALENVLKTIDDVRNECSKNGNDAMSRLVWQLQQNIDNAYQEFIDTLDNWHMDLAYNYDNEGNRI